MKLYITLVFLSLFSCVANGQTNKGSIPPDIYYLEKRDNESKILLKPIKIESSKIAYDPNAIIVIDSNIYRSGDQNLKKYSVKNLILLNKIVDSSSISGVKSILIYKTNKP